MIITTIYGPRDDSEFEKKEGSEDHEDHFLEWVEYWEGEILVHRSVHVTVTKGNFIEPHSGGFNG